MQFGGSTKWAVYVGPSGIVGSVSNCSGVPSTTPTMTITPTRTQTPSITSTPTLTLTPTPTAIPATPINVTGFSAFAEEVLDPEWNIIVGIVLDGAVNQDTIIDAYVNTNIGTIPIGVTIYNGNSSGTATYGFFGDPSPVGPNCLTFVSGDTRVTTTGYTC
jgi:hypothetical protein